MRFTVQNSFPNQLQTAENEFIRRLQICGDRLSIEIPVVSTSTELLSSRASFLLSLHEVSPKLTSVPTIGAMWNPPSGIRHDPTRCGFAASYDGYLSASPSVTQFIAEQTNRFAGPPKPIADFRFYPSSPSGIARATTFDSLVYLGVHWDGARHGDFLDGLARTGQIALYGPEPAWRHAGAAFRGGIPFDGVSVIRRLAEHGIALCLHRDPHVAENTPSMRLFEAASAGCLILSDNIPFAKEMFGESIFILPDDENRADFVREKISWARANPDRARNMARASQATFDRRCSLDVLLPKVVDFGQSIAKRLVQRSVWAYQPWIRDRIDVVYLADERKGGVDRAIAAVNAQIHRHIRLVIVGNRDIVARGRGSLRPRSGVAIVEIDDGGQTFSSMARLSEHFNSEFATLLYPDVNWAPSHLSTLLYSLKQNPSISISFSSVILVMEEGIYINAANFSGNAAVTIQENRLLVSADDDWNDKTADDISLEGLLGRSDWLARALALQQDKAPLNSSPKFSDIAIRSGYVTCFVHKVDITKAKTVTFC